MQGDNGSDHRAGNTHFDHFSASGGSVFFKKPDRVLICDPKFVTRAASRQMIGLPSPRRQEARSRVSIRKNCRRRLIDARIGCQAFTRDGGGVVVDVAIPLRKH